MTFLKIVKNLQVNMDGIFVEPVTYRVEVVTLKSNKLATYY